MTVILKLIQYQKRTPGSLNGEGREPEALLNRLTRGSVNRLLGSAVYPKINVRENIILIFYLR